MTNTKYIFEQKRINNIEWLDGVNLAGITALANDEKGRVRKSPLFYLKSLSINNYEDDIYFVNNTEQTLHFVAPFRLYRNIDEARAKLGDVSAENLDKIKLYSDDMDRLYTDVLPNQGVRIGSYHMMYDSDELMQWFIDVPYKGVESHSGIWHFNVVEKGGIGQAYPLLWDDFSKPSHMVSCNFLTERTDMPIEPSVYEERCWVFDRLIESLGIAGALFVLAINDVLYRYCIGWSAPYNESDIQAKDIAHKLQESNPEDVQAVKAIVQAVYDFWFDKDFTKNVSVEAGTEIFALYQEWLANNKK
ncbi:hypothetical protein [Psychrobacter glacincola]|uniref:hypothetical protein n=1 Tax=Psychrobacter glacincola TaxID=56810 RepID=UPI0039B0252B